MAFLYSQCSEFHLACEAYYEVFVVRKAIFGLYHPSVAVASQELGRVHVRLSEMDLATEYFRLAEQIYTRLKLSITNSSLVSIRKDLASLDKDER